MIYSFAAICSSRTISAMILSAVALVAAGCGGTSSNKVATTGSEADARAEAAARQAQAETDRIIADLDQSYVIGPTPAGEMGYRVVWQHETPLNASLKGIALRGDSVYTLDENNFLTRIMMADGRRRWRIPAADEVLDVRSLNVVDEKVYLTAGSQMLVFDVVNGAPLAKWKLQRVAGTRPVEWGNYLIYGSLSGDLVWLNRDIGYSTTAYHISPALRVPPVIRGNAIAAVGARGEVALLNADSASKYWDKTLLSPVVCRPVIGDELLYVAGQDQYIWGLDLRNGRDSWKYLTEAPLTNSPTLVGDRLYQQVPGTGLLCFNAVPIDLPGGELLWTNADVTGNVVLARRNELFVWDPEAQRLAIIGAERGLTRTRIDLPQTDYLIVGGENDQEIFAASADGRVVRLTPRN